MPRQGTTPISPPTGASRYKRLTINLSPEAHEELTRLAGAAGVSITDYIRKSVALKRFVDTKGIRTFEADDRTYELLEI